MLEEGICRGGGEAIRGESMLTSNKTNLVVCRLVESFIYKSHLSHTAIVSPPPLFYSSDSYVSGDFTMSPHGGYASSRYPLTVTVTVTLTICLTLSVYEVKPKKNVYEIKNHHSFVVQLLFQI